ncbi:MAG: AbrB/MazE/SpoVT family DNA-binding domain-containing protein [Deltaproteobacteria bacterium]|nr:AbrB/MazE/SpoVT family DNA-binding domain-containing protein [Deltaproteobacteria bacterium]MBW2345475.1 AbrB/MazE/SpoVT family DNA-binding domain-containing protein [Deltaproteobacteria bacterium]
MQGSTELQIGKWGNSLGIRLPKHVIEALRLGVKDRISCSVEDGSLILRPLSHQKKYKLDELLAQMEEPGEEISWGKPEGEEVW